MATTNKSLKGDLPIAISTSIPTALVRYQREDFAADYAIGNTPWLSGATDQNRISRITTTYQKERIDQSSSVGEQTLTNWWLRSATSWHHGQGSRYYDAESSELYRFADSNNIDPWTVGELKLLPLTTKKTTVAASQPVTVNGGTFYIANSSLYYYNASTGTATAITMPAGEVPMKLTTDGTYAIIGSTTGVFDASTTGIVRKLWDLPTYAAPTWDVMAIAYVKERIIIGAKEGTAEVGIYEVSRAYGTPTPKIDSSHEIWDSPIITSQINSITEFGSAVVVGYTVGSISRILAFAVNAASPTAALTDGVVIAELPRGETLNQIRTYLNEYVVLATSKGLRVGTIGTDGMSFTYGPINCEGAVADIAFDGNYVYATRSIGYSGTFGLWRLDLGTTVGNGYAYAADLVLDSSVPNGVAFIGTTGLKFMTSTSGTWVEEAVAKAESGYLRSGWIRWGTVERKQPVSLVISSSGTGTVGFELDDQVSQSVVINSIPVAMSTEVGLSGSLQPADQFELIINLSRPTGDLVSQGPVVEEWQIRALPAPLRSRTITLPLLCYEEERDSNGVVKISEPWERITYLERIEQNGGAVLLQDFSSGEERVCVIRAIQFEQTSPPTFASGFGGIVTVQLQTIDSEQAIQ